MPIMDANMLLTVVSLTINVLVVVSAWSKRVCEWVIPGSRPKWATLPSKGLRQPELLQLGDKISSSSARVVVAIISPMAALKLLIETDITIHPYTGTTTTLMEIFFAIQLGFCIYEFLTPFLVRTRPFRGYSEILHHAVAITTYLSILLTKENALLGLIGMFMTADFLMQEVVLIFKLFPEQKKSVPFLICLFLRAVSVGTFRAILPLVTFAVTIANTAHPINVMLPISQVVFFFAVIFFAGFNLWFYVATMRCLYREFKHAIQVDNPSKREKGGIEKSNCVSTLEKPMRPEATWATNDYIFTLAETNLGFSEKCHPGKGKRSLPWIGHPRKNSDCEPTHFYI